MGFTTNYIAYLVWGMKKKMVKAALFESLNKYKKIIHNEVTISTIENFQRAQDYASMYCFSLGRNSVIVSRWLTSHRDRKRVPTD